MLFLQIYKKGVLFFVETMNYSGQKVMLDFDLVSLYRSEAKRLKEPNKSNPDKSQRKR